MRKVWIVLLLLLVFMCIPRPVHAEDAIEAAITEKIEEEIADNIGRAITSADLHEIEAY